MGAVSVVMRRTYAAGEAGTSARGRDQGGARARAVDARLHPVSTCGSMTGPAARPTLAACLDHAPAASPAPPLHRRLVAAVADDHGLPDQRRFRLVLVALLLIAALVGASPSTTAGTVIYVAILLLACTGWLAWTLLPDAEAGAQAGLALAAIAGAALMVPTRGATGIAAAFAAICVSTAVSRLPPPRAVLICVAVVAVFAVATPVAGSHAAVFGLFAVGVGVPAGLVQREHRRRREQTELLLAEAQRTREEQARAAVLAERVRLARDVHDVLAHTLAGLAIQLEAAEALLADADDRERALEVVRRSRGLVVEGIDETRRAVSALRGDAPAVAHGLAALADAAGGQGAECRSTSPAIRAVSRRRPSWR